MPERRLFLDRVIVHKVFEGEGLLVEAERNAIVYSRSDTIVYHVS